MNLGDRHSTGLRLVLLSTILFLSQTQFVFPFSDQNTYLLKAFVAGKGVDSLENDFLIGALDPYPVTTAIFSFFAFSGNYEGILLPLTNLVPALVIVFSLFAIIRRMGAIDELTAWCCLFVSIFVMVLALEPLGLASGVAGQRVYPGVMIPSSAAVLQILAIGLFLKGSDKLSSISLALVVILHPGSALSSGIILSSFVLAHLVEKEFKRAVICSVLFLALAVPMAVYTLHVFSPSDADLAILSKQIIAERRIPHHAIPENWWDWRDAANLLICLAAIAIAWRAKSKLCLVLLFSLMGSLSLSFLVWVSGNYQYYLYFPWRVSGVLFFVSQVVLISFLVTPLVSRYRDKTAKVFVLGGAIYFAAGLMFLGILDVRSLSARETAARSACMLGLYCSDARLEYEGRERDFTLLLEWVRAHSGKTDVYLAPIVEPGHPLEGFRLRSRHALYVDWKSHPYKDVEVIEWYRRVEETKRFYRELCSGDHRISTVPPVARVIIDIRDCKYPGEMLYRNDRFAVLAAEDL